MEYLNCDLKIDYDLSKPNGTPRKILDNSLAKSYGWRSKIKFIKGLKSTYNDFLTL